MSLRTFSENVVHLVVESCLVRDIDTILTPKRVDRMNKETLEQLASEREDIQVQRKMLQDEVKVLRDGLRQCQRHKPRDRTGSN